MRKVKKYFREHSIFLEYLDCFTVVNNGSIDFFDKYRVTVNNEEFELDVKILGSSSEYVLKKDDVVFVAVSNQRGLIRYFNKMLHSVEV